MQVCARGAVLALFEGERAPGAECQRPRRAVRPRRRSRPPSEPKPLFVETRAGRRIANRLLLRAICGTEAADTHVAIRIALPERLGTLTAAQAVHAFSVCCVAPRSVGRGAIGVDRTMYTEATLVTCRRFRRAGGLARARPDAMPRRFTNLTRRAIGRAPALDASVERKVAPREPGRAVIVAQARDARVRQGVAVKRRETAVRVDVTRRRITGVTRRRACRLRLRGRVEFDGRIAPIEREKDGVAPELARDLHGASRRMASASARANPCGYLARYCSAAAAARARSIVRRSFMRCANALSARELDGYRLMNASKP